MMSFIMVKRVIWIAVEVVSPVSLTDAACSPVIV